MKFLPILFFIVAVALPGFSTAILGAPDEGKSTPLPNPFELNASCLVELTKQMNLEKHASLVYKQMSTHFSANNVAKKGFASLFSTQADKQAEHFEKFANYIILRGESVPVFAVEMPQKSQWESVQNAVDEAVQLEKKLYNEIIRVHKIARKTCSDVHMKLFLDSEFVKQRVASIVKFTKLATMIRGAGQGYGEYMIDRDIAQGKLKLEEL